MTTSAVDWLMSDHVTETLSRFRAEALHDAHVETWEALPRCESCDSLDVVIVRRRYHPLCRVCDERIHPELETSEGELRSAAAWGRRVFGLTFGD